MDLGGLDHVALTVTDVARSVAWYRETLDLEHVHEGMWDGVPTMLGRGNAWLALFPVKSKAPGAPPARTQLAVQHVAFVATRAAFDAARETLPARGVPIEFQDHEISHSIYFRDPDGHALEITTYEV